MPGITITANTSVYIFKDSNGFQYTKDSGSATPINNTDWPVTIEGDGIGLLTVTFQSGITFENVTNATNQYFICGSDNIQFGDNNKTTINLNGILNYPGLIQNGYDDTVTSENGKRNITIKNIDIIGKNGTTIATNGGGVAQSYFGRGNSSGTISIDGCSCNINVTNGAGGIAGSGFGVTAIGGTLSISNCYSTVSTDIYNQAGGIAGSFFGYQAQGSSTLSISNCYSTASTIDQSAGGIAGHFFGTAVTGNSKLSIENCYSTANNITNSAGGIAGSYFGYIAIGGKLSIENCYSTGSVTTTNAGGIAGDNFSDQSSIPTITSCYHVGTITGDNGIKPGSQNQNQVTNCLSELKWSDVNAHNYLLGAPTPGHRSGLIWYSISNNTPYILLVFVNTIIPMINEFVNCVNKHKKSSDTTCNQLYRSLKKALKDKTIDTKTANLIKKSVDKHKHNK